MSLEMLTRTEDIRRNVLGNTGNATVRSGSWIARDANGNAKTPAGGEVTAGVAQLVILGNELARPDSMGSETITVQYGQNRFAVGVEGFIATSIVVGSELEISTTVSGASELGYKLKIKASAETVAICESVTADRLVFRTLR